MDAFAPLTDASPEAPEDVWVGLFGSPAPTAALPAMRALPFPMVTLVRHMPAAATMRRALEARPGCGALLESWRKVWERAIGADGIEAASALSDGFATARSEAERHAMRARAGAALSGAGRCRYEVLADDDGLVQRSFGSPYGAQVAERCAGALTWAAHPGLRDSRLHVIDSADSTLSFAHARPGWAFLKFGDSLYGLEGVDGDGLPVIAPFKAGERDPVRMASRRHTVAVESYWRSSAFHAVAGRRTREAADFRVAAFTLAEMALGGADRAFLKGRGSKVGTWAVDLAGVDGPAAAAGALAAATFPLGDKTQLIVQDHVPFVMEHRYFVVDGKVAASTASDRDLCALDRREARILDDRMAVLERPCGEHGAYDRGLTHSVVDRAASARCARLARRLARGLAREERRDLVIDVGITADGRCLAIELNEISLSGPYAVDRRRINAAHARVSARWSAELVVRRERLSAMAQGMLPDGEIPRPVALEAARIAIVDDGYPVAFEDGPDRSAAVYEPSRQAFDPDERQTEGDETERVRSALALLGHLRPDTGEPPADNDASLDRISRFLDRISNDGPDTTAFAFEADCVEVDD